LSFANRSTWIHSSKTLKTPSHSFKSISNATESVPSPPVADQSGLARWRTRYVPLARRSRHWGPQTHA
jgi:hypothetical protein